MPTVTIANRLAQSLPVYLLRDGQRCEVVIPPYGFHGPVERAELMSHTLAFVEAGYLALQDNPEVVAPVVPAAPSAKNLKTPAAL